jgi:hypothetical protein
MNHTQAILKLNKRDTRKLCNNTYLERRVNGDIAVKLHGTDVLTFKPDNSVVYDTGSWHTNTTKDRMNNYGANGFYIWQDKGIWSIGRAKGPRKLYKDGIIITKRGRIIGGGTLRESKTASRLKKQVNDYCKAFALALVDGKVPAPSTGDCMYCHLVTVDGHEPMGDAFKSHDHIRSHIEEGYFVPSLLHNAIQAPWAPISIMSKSCIGELWSGKPMPTDGLRGMVVEQVTKTLRKYIKQRLGMVI